jgi:hypothetical protein
MNNKPLLTIKPWAHYILIMNNKPLLTIKPWAIYFLIILTIFMVLFAIDIVDIGANRLTQTVEKNPPYRLITDGSQYEIQERTFFWYSNFTPAGWNKTNALARLKELNDENYRRNHPLAWTVVTNIP